MSALIAATGAHGLLVLLVYVILALVALGIVWFVATRLTAEFGLPGWIPTVVLAIVVLVVLIWLVDNTA